MSGTYRFAIELTVPLATPPEEPLFLAADVNGWEPDDAACRFARRGEEAFLTFTAERPVVACKVTRGSWLRAECLANGAPMANRNLPAGPALHRLGVVAWADQTPSSPLPPGVHLLHPAMAMPQLGRRRRIWALLPPACRAASERRFRVLYMQDGQNLFDNPHAIYGSWDVDRALRRRSCRPRPTAARRRARRSLRRSSSASRTAANSASTSIPRGPTASTAVARGTPTCRFSSIR